MGQVTVPCCLLLFYKKHTLHFFSFAYRKLNVYILYCFVVFKGIPAEPEQPVQEAVRPVTETERPQPPPAATGEFLNKMIILMRHGI